MVRRRRLAAELRRLRQAAGLTCDEVAERLECSASKISRIETGHVLVSPRDVRDLLDIYDVTGDQRDALIQLARESRLKGWWESYGDSLEPHMATYLGLESEASAIRQYSMTRIPGLLQTEDYAREVMTGGRTGPARYPGNAHRVVDILMDRQRLAATGPPDVWAVMDEAALRRQVGGRQIMRHQIEHLIEMSSRKTVFLQFVPFTTGAYPALDLPFILLSFPSQADPDIAAIGYATGILLIEDMAEVDRYRLIFQHLQAAALPFADSTALMASALKEL